MKESEDSWLKLVEKIARAMGNQVQENFWFKKKKEDKQGCDAEGCFLYIRKTIARRQEVRQRGRR